MTSRMYHRKKVLLALIQTFDGYLQATDCHKMMFLLCQRTENPYYDFFPYKFGAYSFLLNRDKLSLINTGYLHEDDGFKLTSKGKFFNKVDLFTKQELGTLFKDVSKTRGKKLLQRVYTEYPYYATQSQVAAHILSDEQLQIVLNSRNQDDTPSLFTIGYEGITIDRYLNKLIRNNIGVLVDVRKNPLSRKYGFSKSQLRRYVDAIGMTYQHLPELGVPSSMRQNLDSQEAYRNLFEQYDTQILTTEFEIVEKLRDLVYGNRRVALTCFEADHSSCHRSRITRHFEQDAQFELPIIHL